MANNKASVLMMRKFFLFWVSHVFLLGLGAQAINEPVQFSAVKFSDTHYIKLINIRSEQTFFEEPVNLDLMFSKNCISLRIEYYHFQPGQVEEGLEKILFFELSDHEKQSGRKSLIFRRADETICLGANKYRVYAFFDDQTVQVVSQKIYLYNENYHGEKAKPVIYLYPEEECDITVRLSPEGGFKVTDPDYGKGWNIQAFPDGRLINLADGKEYSYLFWESYAVSRNPFSEGFLVQREKLAPFFKKKLKYLGLRKNEIYDFLDFWIPEMSDKPWYWISFVSQDQQDLEAPLSVMPVPDSIIRVYFDHRGLEHPDPISPQKLERKRRKGFSVIEWGGGRY